MKVYIDDEVIPANLMLVDNTGNDWAMMVLAKTTAFSSGDLYNLFDGTYQATQEAFTRWYNYLKDTEAILAKIEPASFHLHVTSDELMEMIRPRLGGDPTRHRQEALEAILDFILARDCVSKSKEIG